MSHRFHFVSLILFRKKKNSFHRITEWHRVKEDILLKCTLKASDIMFFQFQIVVFIKRKRSDIFCDGRVVLSHVGSLRGYFMFIIFVKLLIFASMARRCCFRFKMTPCKENTALPVFISLLNAEMTLDLIEIKTNKKCELRNARHVIRSSDEPWMEEKVASFFS